MSQLSFLVLCGKCFTSINHSTGLTTANSEGVVLSCGDFLCSRCANDSNLLHNEQFQTKCPTCGKLGVMCVSLQDQGQLPEEVKTNMENTSENIEGIHNVLSFQIKYYKRTIKQLLSIIQTKNDENSVLKKNQAILNQNYELIKSNNRVEDSENNSCKLSEFSILLYNKFTYIITNLSVAQYSSSGGNKEEENFVNKRIRIEDIPIRSLPSPNNPNSINRTELERKLSRETYPNNYERRTPLISPVVTPTYRNEIQ
eukprot:gene15137-20378_t